MPRLTAPPRRLAVTVERGDPPTMVTVWRWRPSAKVAVRSGRQGSSEGAEGAGTA